MNGKRLRRKPYHFPGITIIVPEQDDGTQLFLEVKSMPDLTGKGFPDGSKVIRQIANIALYTNREERGKEYVIDFMPPIELRVAYNFDDAMKAGCSIDGLKLAYWKDNAWVIFEDGVNCEYYILPPGTAQVAEVIIEHWPGDPPLAWGG
jgi:hypothetical protein